MDRQISNLALKGTAVLHEGNCSQDVQVVVNLEVGTLLVRYTSEPQDIVDRLKSLVAPAASVSLTNIVLSMAQGLCKAAHWDNLFVARRNTESYVADDAMVGASTAAALEITTIKLIPASSVLELESSWGGNLVSELVYLGGSRSIPLTSRTIDGMSVRMESDASLLTIQAEGALWRKERRFRLTVSLLLGVRASLVCATEGEKIRLNLASRPQYQTSHPLCADFQKWANLFYCLLEYLLTCSDRKLEHWYKATAFMIEGKASFTELDIRVTNLLVFLEMFDCSETLQAPALARMLAITVHDAELICRVRNRLIHQEHTLLEAIREADNQLRQNDAKYALSWFDVSGRTHNAAVAVWLRLCERINQYVVNSVGWSGGHYDYVDIIGPRYNSR
jgi:hypothetical protein